MNGAIGTSYQRCGGQTSSGASPVAAASSSASVLPALAGREGLCGLAGVHPVAPGAQRGGERARGPRLADLGAGRGDENGGHASPSSVERGA